MVDKNRSFENERKFINQIFKILFDSYYVAININFTDNELYISSFPDDKFKFTEFDTKITSKSSLGIYIITYIKNNFELIINSNYRAELLNEYLKLNKYQLIKIIENMNIFIENEVNVIIKNLNNIELRREYITLELLEIDWLNQNITTNSKVNKEKELIKELKDLTKNYRNIIKYIVDEIINLKIKDIRNKNFLSIQKNTTSNLLIIKQFKKIEITIFNSIDNFLREEKVFREKYFKNTNKMNFPKSIYYRGNKLNYDLLPSLYREGDQTPELEHITNNRIIQNMPSDFNTCESFFDKLTILKHFNCPSRLLDITENPLIAAFFALDNYYGKTPAKFGEIHCCFPENYNKIKNSKNSDSVALISALCTTSKNYITDSDYIKKDLEKLQSIFEEMLTNTIPNIFYTIGKYENSIKNFIAKLQEFNLDFVTFFHPNYEKMEPLVSQLYTLITNLNQIISDKVNDSNIKHSLHVLVDDCKETMESLSRYKFFLSELQHQATLINPTFNLYKPKEAFLDTYYIVYPSLNNERIKNQQGLFILVGAKQNNMNKFLNPSKKYYQLFETKYGVERGKNSKRYVYIIDNSNDEFYDELSRTHGINKGFIYPELEKKINQIKDDIKYEYKNYGKNTPTYM